MEFQYMTRRTVGNGIRQQGLMHANARNTPRGKFGRKCEEKWHVFFLNITK